MPFSLEKRIHHSTATFPGDLSYFPLGAGGKIQRMLIGIIHSPR
jgi:hypothetical protein